MHSRHEILAAAAMGIALFLPPGYALAALLTWIFPPIHTQLEVTLFLAFIFAVALWSVAGLIFSAILCGWNDTAAHKQRFWHRKPMPEGIWLEELKTGPLPEYVFIEN